MRTSARVVVDVASGLAAGWVGAQVKAKAESALEGWGEKALPPAPGQKLLPGADPTNGPLMPPAQVYLKLPGVAERQPDTDAVEAGAQWLHRGMAYGSALAYSLLSRPLPALRTGAGSLAGLALFAGTHASALPAAGVQASPLRLPRAWWVWEGGSHVAYGVAVDTTLRVLRRVTG